MAIPEYLKKQTKDPFALKKQADQIFSLPTTQLQSVAPIQTKKTVPTKIFSKPSQEITQSIQNVQRTPEVKKVAPAKIESPFASSAQKLISGEGLEKVKQQGSRVATNLLSSTVKTAQFGFDYFVKNIVPKVSEFIVPDEITTELTGMNKSQRENKWKQISSEGLASNYNPVGQARKGVDALMKMDYMQADKEWENAPVIEKLTTRAGQTMFEMGPSVVSSFIAYGLNPAFGFTTTVGSTAQDISDTAKEYGYEGKQADDIALGASLIIGLFDKIVPARIFKKGTKDAFIKSFGKRLANRSLEILKTGAKEAGTEMTQENLQLIAESVFRNDIGYDEIMTRNALSGFMGAIGGGGVSAINSINRETIKNVGLSIKDVSKNIPDDLTKEAKKYKTAEEFVKAQGTPVYHGTNKDFLTFDPKKINSIESSGDFVGEGFYFIDTPEKASNYAKQAIKKFGGEEVIKEVYLDIKKPLIINNKNDIKKLNNLFGGEDARIELLLDNPKAVREKLESLGYDGLIDNLYGQRAVFSPSQIKTKSQLTDIWEKANKETDLQSEALSAQKEGITLEEFFKSQKISPTDIKGKVEIISAWDKAKNKLSGKIEGPNITDVTPEVFSPNTEQNTTQISKLKGETIDDLQARYVGYQIDNGLVKIEPNPTQESYVGTYFLKGRQYKTTGSKKQDVIKKIFEDLYPDYVIEKEKPTTPIQKPKTVFRGDMTEKGKAIETKKDFGKTLEVNNSQVELLQKWANEGDKQAEKVLQEGKTAFDNNFDIYIDKKASELGYNTVQYNNIDRPQTGIEYRDVKTGESFAENKSTAEVYSYGATPKRTAQIEPSKKANKKNKQIDPVRFLNLVQKERSMFSAYKEGGALYSEIAKIETNLQKRSEINSEVVSGIKNNPYFIKQKDVKDTMGNGWLMTKKVQSKDGLVDRFIVVEQSKIDFFEKRGYTKKIEIDSLASEAGFDNGLDYLETQLGLSKLPKKTQPSYKEMRENFAKESQEYDKLMKELTDLKTGISSEKAILLLEKGKRIKLIKRRQSIRAIRDYFQLSDEDIRKVTRKDPRFMGDVEFSRFLQDLENLSSTLAKTRQAKIELTQVIFERDLKNVDNLQKALKYPDLEDMTIEQMSEFQKILEGYQMHDVFLSQRLLETIDNTRLEGVKTYREVREKLADVLNVHPYLLDAIHVTWVDKFLYDTALARKNPFYNFIIDQFNKYDLQALKTVLDKKKIVNQLAKKARQSRKRTIGERLVPTDKIAFGYAEALDKKSYAEENKMTPQEIDYANFIVSDFARMRDILIQKETLSQKSRFLDDNYVTHTQRPFLEAIKDAGLKKAFVEMFSKNQKEEAKFKIIDNTGNILPFEKFFPFVLSRTGEISPTQNLARAYFTYLQAFEKKHSLDSVIPEIMAYTKILTPEEMTERGLVKDPSLENFIKEWLNNKKGRTKKLLISQGDRLDNIVRSLNLFVTLKDLGLNVYTGLASTFGENVTNLAQLRQKLILGKLRKRTKKGKEIVKQYKNFVGESPFDSLFKDATKHIGEKAIEIAFVLFRNSSYQANIDFLLSSLTKQEWKDGKLSDERLAEMKKEMGRYRVVEGANSVVGSTTEGKTFMKYRGWAVPTLITTLDNLKQATKQIRSGKFNTKEIKELVAVALMSFAIYSLLKDLLKEENDTFLGKLAKKIKTESMSVVSAFDPRLWTKPARLAQLLEDLSNGIVSLIKLEKYETKEGLKGVDIIMKALTFTAISQFIKKDTKYTVKDFAKDKDRIYNEIKKSVDSKLITPALAQENLKKDFTNLIKNKLPEMTEEEVYTELKDFVDNEILTKKEAEKIMIIREKQTLAEEKAQQTKIEELDTRGESTTPYKYEEGENILNLIKRTSKALGADWKTAVMAIFSPTESIELATDERVKIKRIEKKVSQKIKEQYNAKNENWKLDHTVPLAFGGTNRDENLRIVPTEDWEVFTKVEMYLLKKVEDDVISPAEARKLIKKFKDQEITGEELKKEVEN